MDLGHVHLFRKVWKNPVLYERGKRFSRLEAWLWIISIQARGTDDSETGLKRGEFEASVRYLAKSWNWGTTPVFRFLQDLQQGPDPMIMRVERSVERSVERFAERFSICKYEIYNKSWNAERNAERNKVKKEERKIKERETKTSQAADAATVDPLPSVESYQLSEKLRNAIQVRDPNAKAARLPDSIHWARDIDKLMRLDGRRAEDIEAVIAWCQSDGCFWGPNILSGRKLREKFDTMWGQMQRGNANETTSSRGGISRRGATAERTSRGEPRYIPKQ